MDDRLVDRSHRRRPRLRLRLSVRVLMVLVLVFGGGFGWVVHRARVQREAVAAIERAGEVVDYDETFLSPDSSNALPTRNWKGWLVDHLGVDYFESAVEVFYPHDEASPSLKANDVR